MITNNLLLDGYITIAATAKSAFVTAQVAAKTADQAWTSALISLGLLPTRQTKPSEHKGTSTPIVSIPSSQITTANLPSLASTKIAADTALTTAKASNNAAQIALTQALQALGAQ